MQGNSEKIMRHYSLGENFIVSSLQVKKLYEKMCAESVQEDKLTQNEIDVILFLWKNKTYDTARDISKYRCLSRSLVSKSVDSLAQRGYLVMNQDRIDRRYVHLKLSTSGEKVVKKLQDTGKEFLYLIQKDISDDEMSVFLHVLGKIRNNIKKEVEIG